MLVGDTVVGHAGQLHPAVIERSGLPKGTCAVELNLDAIPFGESLPAPAVSPFPAVFQDVALIVDEAVAAQSVVDAVRDGAGELLEDVRLFDVYTGPQIGEGRKSLALALRFRAADRTLTEDEASAARDAAVATAARAGRGRTAPLNRGHLGFTNFHVAAHQTDLSSAFPVSSRSPSGGDVPSHRRRHGQARVHSGCRRSPHERPPKKTKVAL